MDEVGDRSPEATPPRAQPAGLASDEASYSFGPFTLTPARQVLLRAGQPVRLGSRAMALLIALVERSGDLLSKHELVAKAWPQTFVEEGNLRVHIAALRRALGDDPGAPDYVANVAGRGYRFIAPVSEGVQPLPLARQAIESEAPLVRTDTLPVNLMRVLGRDSDIETVASLLAQRRLVTLVGAGGIGKTTVAVSVAHGLKPGHRDGAFFIDLAAVSDPALVPFAVASAVGVAIETGRPVASLVERLQSIQALLLFDNCEHLIGAAAMVVESLLKGAPGIRVLATSHEPLRSEGEWVFRLAPLEVPEDVEGMTLAGAMRYSAVALFVEHATSNHDMLAIGDADVPFIVDICRRLDGLPLAIEIAAARAEVFGIAELAARLDDRLGLLTGGRRTAAARHQTLRSMLDWSHDNLGERDRVLLRRLSVFSGPFTLEAAAMVAGDEHLTRATVTDGVTSLVHKSLLFPTPGAVSSFRLLDSTRIYAAERLVAADEVARVRRLHLHYLCDLMTAAETAWNMTPVPRWVATYRPYVDDIRAALSWAFSADGDRNAGVVLTNLSMLLALQLGLVDEFRGRSELALEQAATLPEPLRVVEMRLCIANNTFNFNQANLTNDRLRRAEDLAEATGLDRHRLEPMVVRSATLMGFGDYETAFVLAERAFELARGTGDEFAILSTARVLAQVCHFSGQHVRATELASTVLRHPVLNIPVTYGFVHVDRRVSMRVVLARALWIGGYSEQAMRVAEEGIAIAPDANALASVQVLALAAIPILLWRGEVERARPLVALLIEQATRFAIGQWIDWGRLYQGVIDARVAGAPLVSVPGGLQAQTLATLAGIEAPAVDEIVEASWCAPELLRIRGERLLRAGDVLGGTADLERALELAREQKAIAWELRAAMSLAPLRPTERRALLADILGRLPEGHENADPVAARALLDRLA